MKTGDGLKKCSGISFIIGFAFGVLSCIVLLLGLFLVCNLAAASCFVSKVCGGIRIVVISHVVFGLHFL